MSHNAYSQLPDSNHLSIPQPQQQSQAQYQCDHNPRQIKTQTSTENNQNLNKQHNHQAVVPLENSQQDDAIPPQITNKNQFMQCIIRIYLMQYLFQSIFHYSYVKNQDFKTAFFDKQNLELTPLFYFLLGVTIIFPILVFKVKMLHQQQSPMAVAVILYTIIFYYFQQSLEAPGRPCSICWEEKPEEIGNYSILVTISSLMFIFNLQGIVQLLVLSFMIRFQKEDFRFTYFYVIAIILSLLWSAPFFAGLNLASYLAVTFAGIGFLFTFLFTFALKRVSDAQFGLQQNQYILGSFSVFIVMVCPLVRKI